MKPKLILINGNPGMGKTTIAKRYAEEHPMTLNLDVDTVWMMMGQWQQSRPQSDTQKYKLAYALADLHLADGYDVVVPDHTGSMEQYEAFEAIAMANNASLKEVLLESNLEDAIERCKTRAKGLGYVEGFRPGGILDTEGRELKLTSMYEDMLSTAALRPNLVRIESVEYDLDGTYARFLEVIQ